MKTELSELKIQVSQEALTRIRQAAQVDERTVRAFTRRLLDEVAMGLPPATPEEDGQEL